MITYGLTKTTINGVRAFVYKINKSKVGIRQVANTPLYTVKTLAAAVGGKKLTSYYSSNRKVPSYIDIYNKATGKTILAFPFSYFNNHSSQANYGEIYGRCQGENIDNRPDQTDYLDMVIDNNMIMHCGDNNGQFNSWDWTNVLVGTSPALILRRDGVARKLYSKAVGWGKYTTANTQTVLASDGDNIIAVIVDGKVLPQKVCDYLMANAVCTDICFGDSGGSAYAYYHAENEPSSTTSNDTKPNTKEDDDVPYRTVKCVKGTLKGGTAYPTRPNLKSTYSTSSYLIKVGDDLQFDDVKPINGKPDCYFQISGGSRPDLIGRWFAYDKDYFN